MSTSLSMTVQLTAQTRELLDIDPTSVSEQAPNKYSSNICPVKGDFMSLTPAVPFEFQRLPEDIQLIVLKRLDAVSFFRLNICSTAMSVVCRRSRCVPRLAVESMIFTTPEHDISCWVRMQLGIKVVKLENLPTAACNVRADEMILGYQNGEGVHLTDTDCNFLLARSVRFQVKRLNIRRRVTCETAKLVEVIEKYGVDEIILGSEDYESSHVFFRRELECFLRHPSVRKLSQLVFLNWRSVMYARMWSDTVLALQASTLRIPVLKIDVVLEIITQWQAGNREIVHLICPLLYNGRIAGRNLRRYSHNVRTMRNRIIAGLHEAVTVDSRSIRENHVCRFLLSYRLTRPAGETLLIDFKSVLDGIVDVDIRLES